MMHPNEMATVVPNMAIPKTQEIMKVCLVYLNHNWGWRKTLRANRYTNSLLRPQDSTNLVQRQELHRLQVSDLCLIECRWSQADPPTSLTSNY